MPTCYWLKQDVCVVILAPKKMDSGCNLCLSLLTHYWFLTSSNVVDTTSTFYNDWWIFLKSWKYLFRMELIWFWRSARWVQCQYLFNLCKAALCLLCFPAPYRLFHISPFSTISVKSWFSFSNKVWNGLEMKIFWDGAQKRRKYESHQCQGLHLRGFRHKKRSKSEW